ncbi:hypothetical protein BJ170DRAFT_225863 [Xylariales sp. AK1849]|nr:hypothetical protein BJ170DRAFT_225863 [Xylariales sp. AK1849]
MMRQELGLPAGCLLVETSESLRTDIDTAIPEGIQHQGNTYTQDTIIHTQDQNQPTAIMDGNNDSFRPQEGATTGPVETQPSATGTHEGVHFTNSFNPSPENPISQEPISPTARERRGSKNYSHTDEWDASKVPPSQFQRRKGSVFSTPASRDGHVGKNAERDDDFHKKHNKIFKLKEKAKDVKEAVSGGSGHRRQSSSGSDKAGV